MDVEKMTNLREFKVELEKELKKENSTHIKIGFFGGRKFSIGDDSTKKYSMNQLIAKAHELALKSPEVSSLELSQLEDNLKRLNQKGDQKLIDTSSIKPVIMFARRYFRENEVKNRFVALDQLCDVKKKEERAGILNNKNIFLEFLRGESDLDNYNIPSFFRDPLAYYLKTDDKKRMSIPDDPTDEQVLDIWERILNGSKLNFSEQARQFKSSLDKMKAVKKDIGEIFNGLPIDQLTISGLEAVNNGLGHFPDLGSIDSQDLKLFVEYFLSHSNEDPLNWIDRGNLKNPYAN